MKRLAKRIRAYENSIKQYLLKLNGQSTNGIWKALNERESWEENYNHATHFDGVKRSMHTLVREYEN